MLGVDHLGSKHQAKTEAGEDDDAQRQKC